MNHSLRVCCALALVAPAAQAQVRALDAPLVYVCTPEVEAKPRCVRNDAGTALLTGSQLNLIRALAALTAKATESDVQRIVGAPAARVADPGTTAYLDGKPIRRRALMWKFDASSRSQEPMDTTLVVTFANELLMNVQLGGVKIPRSNVYFAAMDCEPNCTGRLSPTPSK